MVTLRDIGEFIDDPLEGLNTIARATTGDLFFPMERHYQRRREQMLGPQGLGRANVGQSYRDLPPATFEERFGQWPALGVERELLPNLYDYRRPGEMVPGEYVADPLGHRGLRDIGSGIYFLRRM